MTGFRRAAAAACAVALLASPLAGCGAGSSSTSAAASSSGASGTVGATAGASGLPQGPTIAIGVADDLPGLGERHDGAYSGFDIDVASYVANALGYADKQIVFVPLKPNERAATLNDGDVDMVVAGYAMTDEASHGVTFAGPYLETRPALLTHDDADPSARMTVCTVNGTVVQTMIGNRDGAATRAYDTYGQCMTALMAGSVDAIAGDDATLPGLMLDRRGGYRIVDGLTDSDGSTGPLDGDGSDGTLRYGIAVRHDRDELAERIADALRDMIDDGSWQRFVDADLAPLGYQPREAPSPQDIAHITG